MTAPSWLGDTVREFGRQMGLSRFSLSERGTAGVRFENGISLSLEYVEGRGLFMTASVSMESAKSPGLPFRIRRCSGEQVENVLQEFADSLGRD